MSKNLFRHAARLPKSSEDRTFASAAGGGNSEQKGVTAVEKIEEQRKPEDFFGYRNKGNSHPSAYIGTVGWELRSKSKSL